MMATLLCAATRIEAEACARGSGAEVLRTGVGAACAGAALEERIARSKPSRIVSTGFAGATGLAPLVWVRAARVFGTDGEAIDVTLVDGPDDAIACDVHEVADLVTQHAREGQRVVDMESAALARVAAAHGLPFAVVRLVTDTPAAPLPAFLGAFTAAMAARGPRRAAHALRGIRDLVRSPADALALARAGKRWPAALTERWRRARGWI
jgi:adenosylhomocysteine nucleosidase